MSVADISFLGSGIASTLTLIELFRNLTNATPSGTKLDIVVIEKSPELWLGIPYGSRSSVNALTITCAYDFIYEQERPAFFKWLLDHKLEWVSYYRDNGGAIAEKWLQNNLAMVENEDWETVYIPRFLYGRYLLEIFTHLRHEVEQKQLVNLKTIHAEATDVVKLDDGNYEIALEYGDGTQMPIASKKVVIATGSAPVKVMHEKTNGSYTYINDMYEPAASKNLEILEDALEQTTDKGDRNVLVIGTNASSIELLYLLSGMPEVTALAANIVAISPSGALPYLISTAELDEHPTPHLDNMGALGNYDLQQLVDTAGKDLHLALADGANVAYIATVITTTLKHLEPLGETGKKEFFGKHGMRLSNMFRRAGPEYKLNAESLVSGGLVTLIKGSYNNTTITDKGAVLHYTDAITGESKTYPHSFKVVINCTGANNVDQSPSRLITNLLKRNLAQMNLSCKGFEVNERFESAPNLYIMGPLLGGNMNKVIHFWHLENAPRLTYLAPHLAKILME